MSKNSNAQYKNVFYFDTFWSFKREEKQKQ